MYISYYTWPSVIIKDISYYRLLPSIPQRNHPIDVTPDLCGLSNKGLILILYIWLDTCVLAVTPLKHVSMYMA